MTTTVALACKEAVILGSDRRATNRNLIASKNIKKVLQIDDRIALTTAGLVGDAQRLAKVLGTHAHFYRIEHQRSISVGALVSWLCNVLNERKFYPFEVQLIIGGVDNKKIPHIFEIDAAGGSTEETAFTATGSGSPIAYGALESGYSEDMSIEQGKDLVAQSVRVATKRDSASGESIQVVTITAEKYEIEYREI